MPALQLRDFHTTGIIQNAQSGPYNGLYRSVAMDYVTEPGIIRAAPGLYDYDDGGVVTEQLLCSTIDGAGTAYFGGSSGGFYSVDSSGTWTKLGTVSPSSGAAGILGMELFTYGGTTYVYYAMQSYVGEWDTSGAFSGRNDSWNALPNAASGDPHPTVVVAGNMYIGDGNDLSLIDNTGTFTQSALDLPEGLLISALLEYSNEILIGTKHDGTFGYLVQDASIYRWDTWSPSYTNVVSVTERDGVFALMNFFGTPVAQCGEGGRFYRYTGTSLERFYQFPGVYNTNKTGVHVNTHAFTAKGGAFYLAVENDVDGVNPVPLSVYRFIQPIVGGPIILDMVGEIIEDKTDDIEVNCMQAVGNVVVVPYKNKDTSDIGVVNVGSGNSAYTGNHYIETRVIDLDRKHGKNFRIEVFYRDIPDGCSIAISTKTNYASSYTAATMVVDALRNRMYTTVDITKANTIQIKMEFTTSGTDSPEVEEIYVEYL